MQYDSRNVSIWFMTVDKVDKDKSPIKPKSNISKTLNIKQ